MGRGAHATLFACLFLGSASRSSRGFLGRLFLCDARRRFRSERFIIRNPRVHVSLKDRIHRFDDAPEFSPACARHHHPAEDHRLSQMTIGWKRREVIEESGRCGFLDRAPDFAVARERFGGALLPRGERTLVFRKRSPAFLKRLANETLPSSWGG
jgi:hypothetical protein